MLDSAELYYYKARVYDPAYGRFLQTDPVGSKDDLNLYAYVGGDPVNRGDPTGLATANLGFEVNAVAGYGDIGVGDKEEVGIAVELTAEHGLDIAVYRTSSDSLDGAMVGAGPTIGVSRSGSFNDMNGEATTETACVGLCVGKSTPSS